METKEEQLVLFATSVATQLACGLSKEELEDLRCIINHISCSISTIISLKCNRGERERREWKR